MNNSNIFKYVFNYVIVFIVLFKNSCHTIKNTRHREEDGFRCNFDGKALNNWVGAPTGMWKIVAWQAS